MEATYSIGQVLPKSGNLHENPGIPKALRRVFGEGPRNTSHTNYSHTHYKNNSKSVIERKKELEEIAKG
jgi:NADH-quinone oxidoreductase subunit G